MAPDYDNWKTSGPPEGEAYAAVVEAAGPPAWPPHGDAMLEDFAESCGRYLVSMTLDSRRTEFFERGDFK